MENLFLFLATSLVLRTTTPRFKRYILFPGCSTLLNSGAKMLHIRYTREGDKLYFNEYAADGVTYGLVCVRMNDRYTLHQAEDILVQYMNRMRKPLHVPFNVSMTIERKGDVLSITDYWQDEAGIDWKVKGHTNGETVAVLFVKNISVTTVGNHDAYLNGMSFSPAT